MRDEKRRPGLPRDRSLFCLRLRLCQMLKGIFTYAIFLSLSSFCWWGQSAAVCAARCTLPAFRRSARVALLAAASLLLLLLRVVCCCLIFYKIGMKSAFPLRYFSFARLFFTLLPFFWHFIYFNFLISSLCGSQGLLQGVRVWQSGAGGCKCNCNEGCCNFKNSEFGQMKMLYIHIIYTHIYKHTIYIISTHI